MTTQPINAGIPRKGLAMQPLQYDLCKEYIGGPAALWAEAGAAWQKYHNDPAVLTLSQALHQALVERADPEQGTAVLQQLCQAAAPGEQDILALTALVSLLPAALRVQNARGIPQEVQHATFPDILIWAGDYAQRHGGKYGIDELTWLIHPYSTTIFRLGSLQYQSWPNPFPVHAYLNGTELALFMAGDIPLAADGRVVGTNGLRQTTSSKTVFTERSGIVTGHRIDPATATASLTPTQYNISGGKHLLAPGQQIVMVHIPKGADLSDAAIAASRAQADRFFEQQKLPHSVFLCDSWLLDPNLKYILPPTSKVLQFARNFVTFPIKSDRATAGRYVFRSDYTPELLSTYPARTTLQQKMRSYLQNGNELFDIGGIMLPISPKMA